MLEYYCFRVCHHYEFDRKYVSAWCLDCVHCPMELNFPRVISPLGLILKSAFIRTPVLVLISITLLHHCT